MSIKYHKRPQRFSFQLHKVSRGDKSTDTDKVGVTGALGSLGGLKGEAAEDNEFLLGTVVAAATESHTKRGWIVSCVSDIPIKILVLFVEQAPASFLSSHNQTRLT